MLLNHSSADKFSGIYNLSLEKRKFDPSRDDIERICRFFSLGKLRHYEIEKGVIGRHLNFFIFVATSHGRFALKFFPSDAAKLINIAYVINQVLLNHHFPTPAMHTGISGRIFFPSNERLATCYSYIDGKPSWKYIKQRRIFLKINDTMFFLKEILSTNRKSLPSSHKKKRLSTTIRVLAQYSRFTAPYDQKETVEASILDACRAYQNHQLLFTRQWLHTDIHLANFLIYKDIVYTFDVEHIMEAYALTDLQSLVNSCLILDMPVKSIIKSYFTRHKLEPQYYLVLNTLIKIGLIQGYLKNIQLERSIGLTIQPPDFVRTFNYNFSKRQKSIVSLLKKMNDDPDHFLPVF